MAQKGAATTKKVTINKFYGVNESDIGQTALKLGESPYMRNFRIDQNGKLQKRKGWCVFSPDNLLGCSCVWYGVVGGQEQMLVGQDETVYKVNLETGERTAIYTFFATVKNMFFYKDCVYILCDSFYYTYNGSTFTYMETYIPTVEANVSQDGTGGKHIEDINLICNSRRYYYNCDGATRTIKIQIDSNVTEYFSGVKYKDQAVTGYTYNRSTGIMTVPNTYAEGENVFRITVSYIDSETENTNYSATIGKMKYSSVCGGRIFFWGDPDNKSLLMWSCTDYKGNMQPGYYTEKSRCVIGTNGYAITDVIQQNDKIIVFTEGDAWVLGEFNEDNSLPENRIYFLSNKGLAAPKGAQIINNKPVTITNDGVYEWVSTGINDEKNAKLISQRVAKTLSEHNAASAVTFDNEKLGELWLCFSDGICVIYNYRIGVWYIYNNIFAKKFVCVNGKVYFLSNVDDICAFSEDKYTDDGETYISEWEMDFNGFGASERNKNLRRAYVGLEPENRASYKLYWQTDKDSYKFYNTSEEIGGSYAFFSYDAICYDDFSYDTLYTPKVFRHRLMLKHFSFIKLYLKNDNPNYGCMIVGITLEGYTTDETKE